MTNREFIEQIAKFVQKYAPNYGIKVHSPIIAQAILESGWGKSSLAAKYHNYFGLKCGSKWTGKSVNMATSEEYTQGVYTNIRDNFRVFDSMENGVKGYFEFISYSRYANLKGITDPQKYLETIKADGYATSFTYVSNNMKLISQYNLTQYDGVAEQTPSKKSIDEIAQEVIRGEYGNGSDRKAALEKAGYNYAEVQKKVNELCSSKKSITQIVQEVVQGKWGNGDARKKALTDAGYNYAEVQKKVNELLKPKKSNDEIAKEVVQGKWGNGQARKDALTKAGYNYAEVQKIVNKLL